MRRAVRLAASLLGIAVLPASLLAGAQVYRYKDEHGQWVYTDQPPSGRSDATTLSVRGGAAAPRMVVQQRRAAAGVAFVAVNECRCTVEFGVRVAAGGGPTRSARAVVAPQSEQVMLELAAPGGTGELPFQYIYVVGDPSAVHSPPAPYRAPFAVSRSFQVTQAAPDSFTHRDDASRHAVDVAMPVGTAVHAAREGTVINVARGNFRGGTTREMGSQSNFVQVLHDDGTTAVYAHLQLDTVRVRPGQRVARGEYIANSGNTGYSTGPHLHFAVLRNAGLKSESLPVTFAGPGGVGVTPRTGQALTAY